MQRITTANREVDKFGFGKDGFKGDPDATDLEPAWCDSVQEEIARCIEDQGIALDGGDLGQLAAAINSWTFSGTPRFEGDVAFGALGSDIMTVTAAAVTVHVGLVAKTLLTSEGNTVIGTDSGDSCTINATVTCESPVVFNNAATFNNNINIGSQTLSGGAGSHVDVEAATVTEIRWDSSGATDPDGPGETRWNDTYFSLCDGAFNVRTFDDPVRGHDASFTTPNAIASTTATASRRIKHNEQVWVEIFCRFEGDAAPANLNYRIQVTGPLGSADILIDTGRIEVAGVGYFMHEAIPWVPTDSFGAELAVQNYTFLLRLGVSSGNLTADRSSIKVSPNHSS